jgi:hypothetical protein
MSKNNNNNRIPSKKFQSMVEDKLKALNLTLPEPFKSSSDMKMPPSWIRLLGNRAFILGHRPQNPDGSIAGPLGKVGTGDSDDVTLEQAYQAARLTTKTTAVINGCSELILELYGQEVGQQARTAMGVATTPFGLPVIIAAEVEIDNNSI